MADTATAGQVNQSEWGGMTAEQRAAEIDSGFQQMEDTRQADLAWSAETDTTGDTSDDLQTARESADTTSIHQSTTGDETPAGSEAATAKKTAAKAEPATTATTAAGKTGDWLTPEDRETATTYGLDGDFLNALPSREVFDRVLQAIDKKAFEAGKLPAQQTQQQTTATQTGQQSESQQTTQQAQQAAPQATTGNVGDPFADLTKFKMDESVIEETAAKPFNDFVETTATTIRQLQAELAGFRQERSQQAFSDLRSRAVSALHSLGHAELFGKPGETPTTEQAANIEKAIDAHFTHAKGLLATGRQAAPTPAFLKAAVHLAFGDQLTQQQQRQMTERLKAQSRQRMGGGTSRPIPKENRTGNVADDPELDELFNNLVSERGT